MASRIFRVEAFPRVHIGLLDLAAATPRRYGGAGFSIQTQSTIVQADVDKDSSIEHHGLDTNAINDLNALLERMHKNYGERRISLKVIQFTPQHVGLGSKTCLLLAAATAGLTALNSPTSPSTIQRLSQRGGTSGVGIHSFFTGGFVVDCGHPQPGATDHLPSSAQVPTSIPPLQLQLEMPAAWRASLAISPGTRISGPTEQDFFRLHTPISSAGALEAIALMYHGIVPAIRSANLSTLKDVLNRFHNVGFKSCELQNQTSSVQSLFRCAQDLEFAAVGLSSIGPTIYIIHHVNNTSAPTKLAELCTKYSAECLLGVPFRNSGYDIWPADLQDATVKS